MGFFLINIVHKRFLRYRGKHKKNSMVTLTWFNFNDFIFNLSDDSYCFFKWNKLFRKSYLAKTFVAGPSWLNQNQNRNSGDKHCKLITHTKWDSFTHRKLILKIYLICTSPLSLLPNLLLFFRRWLYKTCASKCRVTLKGLSPTTTMSEWGQSNRNRDEPDSLYPWFLKKDIIILLLSLGKYSTKPNYWLR